MKKEEFIWAFHQQYGYICVSDEVVGNFYDTFYQIYHNVNKNGRCYTNDCILDLCKDFILSQNLVEEVVE